jgi:hypothetical protein
MSVFDQAISAAHSVLQSVAGQTISYHRGSSSVELVAVPAARDYEVTSDYGARATWSSVDWLLPGDQLILGGERITPEPGDQIRQVIDGVGERIWEIMPIPGRGHLEDRDPSGTRIRVHSKQISE